MYIFVNAKQKYIYKDFVFLLRDGSTIGSVG